MAALTLPESLRQTAARLAHAYPTPTLYQLREPIVTGLKEEDGLPERAVRKHGYRQFSDFRIWCDAIEAELRSRGEQFTPVDWALPRQ